MTVPRISKREDGDPSSPTTRRRKRSLGVTLLVLGASTTAAFAQDVWCSADYPDPPEDCWSFGGYWSGGHRVGRGHAFRGARGGFGGAGTAHGAGSSGG